MPALSVVDCGFNPRSSETKEYVILGTETYSGVDQPIILMGASAAYVERVVCYVFC